MKKKSRDGRRSPSLFFRGICVMATVSYGDGESPSLFLHGICVMATVSYGDGESLSLFLHGICRSCRSKLLK